MNWEWLAGFIDGEGCFTRTTRHYKSTTYRYPRVQITQCGSQGLLILKEIRQWLGYGWISIRIPKNPKWLINYNYDIEGKLAIQLTQCLLPFLRVKREAAMKALELSKD